MPQFRAGRQQLLFEDPPRAPAVRLPLDVQERLRQALVQWMQVLAQAIRREEAGDEQDHT